MKKLLNEDGMQSQFFDYLEQFTKVMDELDGALRTLEEKLGEYVNDDILEFESTDSIELRNSAIEQAAQDSDVA